LRLDFLNLLTASDCWNLTKQKKDIDAICVNTFITVTSKGKNLKGKNSMLVSTDLGSDDKDTGDKNE